METMCWLLDVHFKGNYWRVEDRNVQQNLNMLRKLAMNLIKTYKERCSYKHAISEIMFVCLLDSCCLFWYLCCSWKFISVGRIRNLLRESTKEITFQGHGTDSQGHGPVQSGAPFVHQKVQWAAVKMLFFSADTEGSYQGLEGSREIENVLFGDGKKAHFKKFMEFYTIFGKSNANKHKQSEVR